MSVSGEEMADVIIVSGSEINQNDENDFFDVAVMMVMAMMIFWCFFFCVLQSIMESNQ